MRVRQPEFDFSQSTAHWAPDHEFAQLQNAGSLGIPPLERFLNRVMAKARKEIKGADAASAGLRADITTFIRQESCHYATHDRMNAILVRDGYDRIPEFERIIETHYARLFETKSLAFLTAYCEGFETLGPASAMAWCGDSLDSYLEGADPEVVMAWQWHLLEEYEHRHVCYDVFERIHGGYFLRIYAFFYQLYWFKKLSGQVGDYLLATDRANMTDGERAASRRRQKTVGKMLMSTMARNLFKVVLPWYRPHILPMPKMWRQLEGDIDSNWIKRRKATMPDNVPVSLAQA